MNNLKTNNKNRPLISIIVPIYNSEPFLAKCLDSLIGQTYDNTEIILVNDGSTDLSLSICHKYEKDHSNIKVIDTFNGGAAHARNLGLNEAKGDYIGFVDSDDYIDKNMYKAMIDRILEDNSDVCCCGRYDIENGIISKGLCPNQETVISGYDMINHCFRYDKVDFSSCDKLFKKSLWNSNLFPEGKTGEDVYALYTVLINCKNVSLIPRRYYYYCHRYRSASMMGYNKHTFDFEYYTKLIFDDVKANNRIEIYDNARYFRMKSLIYSLSYSGKVDRKTFKKLKEYFEKCFIELKSYKNCMKRVHKKIYYAYKFHLESFYYFFIWSRISKENAR